MNKRKGILEELIEKCTDNILIEKLLKDLHIYFENYDLDFGTNHRQIFQALYFQRKKYEAIIFETFVSDSTLQRYLKRYNRLATKFILNKIEYSGLIEYLK